MNIFKKIKNFFTFTDSQTMNQEVTNEEQKVKEEEKEYIFCPECNAMNSDYRTHCIRCGHYLKEADDLNTENYKIDSDIGSTTVQEDLDSLDEDEKRLLLEINKYIEDDINNRCFRIPLIFEPKYYHVEKYIQISFDDTIDPIDHLCVNENLKGYKACGLTFDSTKSRLTEILPIMYRDNNLINIFSLALTIDPYKLNDYLHCNRLAILETIIYTSSIYIINLYFTVQKTNKDSYFKYIFKNITNVIEYLFDISNEIAAAMLYIRFNEYIHCGKEEINILPIFMFSKHWQYEMINKSFSLSKFRICEIYKPNKESLIKKIKILTKNILNKIDEI